MESEMTCPICLDIAVDAVETACCHHIYCAICTQGIAICPECRSTLAVVPSIVIRRIIGNMTIACTNDGCGVNTTRSNLAEHKMTCAFQAFSCPAPGCAFEGVKDAFAHHVYTQHTDRLVKHAESLFTTSGVQAAAPSNDDRGVDRILTVRTSRGVDARLGTTGKYYCGQRLNTSCGCCNGSCGPTNGCNCNVCMKLDIEARQLSRGWYVNKSGYACRKGGTGIFYCGRYVMQGNRMSDGYCGPTDGPNCEACQYIGAQHTTRYADIWF